MPMIRHLLPIVIWLFFGWNRGLFTPESVLIFVAVSCLATLPTGERLFERIKARLGWDRFHPADWYYNEYTGEHHFITARNKEGILYDATSYMERLTARIMLRETISAHQFFAFLLALLSIFLCVSLIQVPQMTGKGLFVSTFVYCFIYADSWNYQAKFYRIHLGPEPGSPSRHLVEQQKAYGAGRWLTPEEVNASSGGAHNVASIDDYMFPN